MITKKGVVSSVGANNTVTVTVHRFVLHPIYKKRYRRSKKFLVDSTGQQIHVGDQVVIEECNPISKRKHFRVSSITQKAPNVSELKEEEALKEVMEKPKKKDEIVEQDENEKTDSHAESNDSDTSSEATS